MDKPSSTVKGFSPKEIRSILESCRTSGVLRFKYHDLEIELSPTNVYIDASSQPKPHDPKNPSRPYLDDEGTIALDANDPEAFEELHFGNE